METKKMSLANIQGKLNRAEMKNIMAGSGEAGTCGPNCNLSYRIKCGDNEVSGNCHRNLFQRNMLLLGSLLIITSLFI